MLEHLFILLELFLLYFFIFVSQKPYGLFWDDYYNPKEVFQIFKMTSCFSYKISQIVLFLRIQSQKTTRILLVLENNFNFDRDMYI